VNAYDTQELKLIDRELGFDKSWDEKSKYMTKQILTVPIFYKKYVIGVLQLINKKGGDRFSLEDQNSAVEMAKVLGIAFFNQKKMAQQRAKRTKFDWLTDNNIITESELENAISMARARNTSIEAIFLKEMKVRKDDAGRRSPSTTTATMSPLTAITLFRGSAGKIKIDVSQEQPVGSPGRWMGRSRSSSTTRSGWTGSTASSLCFLQKATSSRGPGEDILQFLGLFLRDAAHATGRVY
jgi:hypothetical protein